MLICSDIGKYIIGRDYPLGDIPLIVLTSGKNRNADRDKLQADLVRLSRNGKQIIAEKSDHHIQIDHPEIVANATEEVVQRVRNAMVR